MKKYLKISVYTLAFAAMLMLGCKQPTTSTANDGEGGKTFTVTFDLNGKTLKDGSSAPEPQDIKANGRATAPAAFEITDDTVIFDYWTDNKDTNAKYKFSDPVTQNITLYAVYADLLNVTLDYHNGTPNGSAKAKKDGTVLIKHNPHKADALFKHWSTADNGDKATGITDGCTLHAVYHTIDSTHTRIRDIQGTSHTSPKKNNNVTNVPGVVTALTYSKGNPSGFYMQDLDNDTDPATSEGISVYCGKNMPDVKVGDAVTVTGKVKEHQPKDGLLSITQITTAATDIVILSSKNKLPEPVDLTEENLAKDVFKGDLDSLDIAHEAIDYYESLEGMRVKVTQPKVVAAPYDDTHYIAPKSAAGYSARGGIMYNSYKNTGLICMYANGTCFANPADLKLDKTAALGDSYTGDIIGVLTSFYNYQIVPTEPLPTLTKGSITPEASNITFDASKLNIVSYNLENFSYSDTSQSYDKKKKTWGKPELHTSGLTAAQRAEGFAKHLVTDMKSPDVICLIEIQDDDSATPDPTMVSAEKTLALLIEKIKAVSGAPEYKAVNIDPEKSTDSTTSVDGGAPGANIRCCYLYRTDRIELVADSDNNLTNSTHSTEAEIEAGGSKLKQNPARIGTTGETFKSTRKSLVAHFKFTDGVNGKKDFFVINNHFSSKRGDQPTWGCNQPAKRDSEKNRHKQAEAVVDFIKKVKTANTNAAVISVGDYNDFWFSDTVKKFKDAGMENVIEKLDKNARYTYVYNGHFQTLDNILVTDNVTIHNPDVLHVNAEVPADKRLSDHDPVFVQLSW